MFTKLILFLFLLSSNAWATNYCTQAGACYLYNEGSGTSTADNSGNSNTGTFHSSGSPAWSNIVPSFATGGFPFYSTLYNGTSDYINYGTSDNVLLYTNPLTITAWVYPTGTQQGWIVAKSNNTSPAVVFQYDAANISNTDIQLNVSGTTNLVRDSSNTALHLKTWNFIAVTWDGSTTATNIHLYVNNVETTYVTTTNGVSLASNSGKTIATGGNIVGNNKYFIGYITNVGIFTSVLSSTALTAIYNSGLTGNHSNIIQGGSIRGIIN